MHGHYNPDIPLEVVKLTTSVTAGAMTGSLFGFDPYLVAFFGVGFTTLGMASAGALFSFAFGSRTKNRPMLFFQAVAATFIGTAAVTGVPEFFNIDDVAPRAQPVVGFFYALFARWVMPLMVDILPMLVRRWFNISTDGDTK